LFFTKINLKIILSFKKKSAFSLVELSIVIVIIGLLLVGVIGSKHLVEISRISSAKALTSNSPISATLDNALWLESSIVETAFSDNLEAGDGDDLDSWKDRSYNQNKPIISKVGTGPTYANTINNIQAVQFSASDSNYLQITDASFLNNTDYTIFVLEKREANSSDNYFIGDDSVTTANQTLILGYSTDTSPIHSQGIGNNYTASLEAYVSYSGSRIFTFTSDSTKGKKMYINGVLAAEDADTTQLTGITTLPIGMGYNGEIGEIAIFTRALKAVERQSIEDYMGNKWNNNINRESVSSCLTGTLTSAGCEATCSAPSVVNGITSSTTIADGESSTYSCDDTGYSGNTPEYTCASGSLSPTAGDCTDNNSCAIGYNIVDDSCQADCILTAQTGLASTTTVISGSTSQACDVSGTIAYTCVNGYLDNVVNSCVTTCSLDDSPIAGVTQTGTVAEGTSTFNGSVHNSVSNSILG